VKLAALVDRGGRQLPIAPQFVGTDIEVPRGQSIELTRDAKGRLSLVLRQEEP
jgi:pyrimidine operon attenuation protein/uracil phosphoribosyltransferase